jgi:hypothetical protein
MYRSLSIITVIAIAGIAAGAGNSTAQAIPLERAASIGSAEAAYTVGNGSYYLSRNIVLKGKNANAINITGPNVSIDFRGYSIIGKKGAGGIGINAPNQPNVVIQNGNIIGMGGGGVVVGNGGTVTSMHITGGGGGIVCGSSCVIADNSISGNNGDGISAAGLIRGNTVDGNTGNGITAGANSSITGNELSGNTGTGIAMQPKDGFSNNVISGGATTTGGVDAGNNVCNGSVGCP